MPSPTGHNVLGECQLSTISSVLPVIALTGNERLQAQTDKDQGSLVVLEKKRQPA